MPVSDDAPDTDLEVEHDADASRYYLRRAGAEVGLLGYRRRGDVVETYTTQISPSVRGQGLGAVLVGHVLDELRAQGSSVIPTCWYVDQFIDEHPEYAELRATDGGGR